MMQLKANYTQLSELGISLSHGTQLLINCLRGTLLNGASEERLILFKINWLVSLHSGGPVT